MRNRKQLVEYALTQLMSTMAVVLSQNVARSHKLADAIMHADYTFAALNMLASQRYREPLLSETAIRHASSLIVESVNQAINTRTNVMMSTDKSGRRYRLHNALERYLLIEMQKKHIYLMAEIAFENDSLITIVNGNQLSTVSPKSSVEKTVKAILERQPLNPYSNAQILV